MDTATRLLFTKYLFLFSIICTFLSNMTEKAGYGIIYPFFSWKLFSQPMGTHHISEEYRIYSKKKSETAFHRNPVFANPLFNTDDYVYTLNYYTKKSILNPTLYKTRLLDFCQYCYPNMEQYKIVLETYNPTDLYSPHNKYQYDTTTIITFKGLP